jgi:hypothetical protein
MGTIFVEETRMTPNQSAAAIRSGWATTEKNFAARERFALGESSLRAQTSPLQRRPVRLRKATAGQAGRSDGSGNGFARAHSLCPAGLRLPPNSFHRFPSGSSGLPKPATIWLPQVMFCVITHRDVRDCCSRPGFAFPTPPPECFP